MKYFYLLFAALLFPLFSIAQSTFIPGYVITLSGDTIKGSVNYKEWDKNPQSINFKNSKEKIEQYTPSTSMGFGITGQEYYQSHLVSISQDRTSISELHFMLDTSVINKTVYLRVLTTGPNITLYKYKDNIKSRFYYATPTKTPQELTYVANYASESSPGQISNRFRIQLQIVVQQHGMSTPQSDWLIAHAEYDESHLVKIAQFINNNTNYTGTQNQVGSRFFVGLGANLNSIQSAYGTVNNTSPEFSAGVDLFANKITQAFFFRIALSVTGAKFDGKINGPSFTPNVTALGNSIIKQTYISYNPQVGYNLYNAPNLKVYISMGVGIHQAVSNYFTETYVLSNAPSTTHNDDYKATLYKFQINLPVIKAGATINKRIEVFAGRASFKLGDGFNKVNVWQAGANYLFGKM